MTTWMDHETFASQWSSEDDLDKPVPRPDDFPESVPTSRSYWICEYPIALDQTCADTPLPPSVDVVIIGSGMTGAAALYRIAETQPSLRVALVEARGLCTGATGRNGGHFARPECYHLAKTAAKLGAEDAIRLREAGIRNRDMMLACIEKLGGPEKVDLRLNGTVVVFETAEELDAYRKDLELATNHGYKPEGRYLGPEDTAKKFDLGPELCKFGAAYLEKSGTFHPRKFVHLLLQKSLELMPNLTIHPHTPVSAIHRTDTPASKPRYDVVTSTGTISTRAVFHATNAYAGHLCTALQGSQGVFGAKAHMLAITPNVPNCTRQLAPGFGYGDFWHYLHQRPDRGPFLYGFADAEVLHDYDDSITLPADHPVRARMVDFLQRLFPAWFRDVDLKTDVSYDWTGIQGLTLSGASIVGRPDAQSLGEFACVGHNGEGMGRCFSGATVAADALLAYLDGREIVVPEWYPRCNRKNI